MNVKIGTYDDSNMTGVEKKATVKCFNSIIKKVKPIDIYDALLLVDDDIVRVLRWEYEIVTHKAVLFVTNFQPMIQLNIIFQNDYKIVDFECFCKTDFDGSLWDFEISSNAEYIRKF